MPLFEVTGTYVDTNNQPVANITKRYDGTKAAFLTKLNTLLGEPHPEHEDSKLVTVSFTLMDSPEAL